MVQKILFTLLAVVLVWIAFKYWDRMLRQRPGERRLPRGTRTGTGTATRSEAARGGADVFETEKCPVCGSYVAASGATDCGRPNCPYGA